MGEIEDQVAAAHAYEIYLLVLERGVGTVFGPDLHAGVEAEASVDERGAPSGVHCTERQQRHQGTLAAVEVGEDRTYTGSIDESARGNICAGSVEGPNPRANLAVAGGGDIVFQRRASWVLGLADPRQPGGWPL